MTKYDESEGQWRTIGGRRVFIKDGQSLSDAMKASGKFKKSKHSLLDDEDHNRSEISKEMHKAERKYDRLKKLEDLHKDDEQYKKDLEEARKEYSDLKKEVDKMDSERDQLKEKYMNIPEDERVKAYEEGKNWKDFVKERESKLNEDEVTTKAQWKQDYGNNIEELERDLKNSEMYLDEDSEGYAEAKKSLENGKEYLNELKSKSNSNVHDELLKEKQDRLSKQKSLEKDAKKYVQDESKTRDNYIRDKMEQGVRAEDSREAYNRELEKKMSTQEKQIRKTLNNEENKYSLKQIKEVYKKEDYTEVINTLSQREISKMDEAQFDMDTSPKGSPAYKNAEDYIERMENKAASKWLDMQKKESNKTINNSIRNKAFKKYKKEHPGSKMTLKEFLKK